MKDAKFKPGDVVEHVVSHMPEEAQKQSGIRWGRQLRWYVLWVQYDRDGYTYACRWVTNEGNADFRQTVFTEQELVLSRPFREDPTHDVVDVPPAPK